MQNVPVWGLSTDQWTAIAAIGNIAVGVGLVIFAGMQWFVTARGDRRAEAIKAADERAKKRARKRELDVAYSVIRAEQFRLWNLFQTWKGVDIVSQIAAGLLTPDLVSPSNRGTLAEKLGLLGYWPSVFGNVAIARFNDVARLLLSLRADTQDPRFQLIWHTELRSEKDEAAVAETKRRLALLHATMNEAVTCLEDALRCSEPAKWLRAPDLRGDLQSEYAKRFAQNAKAAITGTNEGRFAEYPLAADQHSSGNDGHARTD